MSEQKITVPNIGDFKEVEVIEVLVKEGQIIKKNDSVITLESDKSSVEVPSNYEGKVKQINIKIGDKVSEGSIILLIETSKIEETKDISYASTSKKEKKNEVIDFPVNKELKKVTSNTSSSDGKGKICKSKCKKICKRVGS